MPRSIPSIRRRGADCQIELRSGESVRLGAQELWDLSEAARAFLIANPADPDSPLFVTDGIQKNDCEIRFVVSENVELWKKVGSDQWEPGTFAVFDRFIDSETVYLDIGAWIGTTVLYASQRAKMSYAFEPDPVACRELRLNVAANAHNPAMARLEVREQAIGLEDGSLTLAAQGRGGDSCSSVLPGGDGAAWQVTSRRLDSFLTSFDHEARFFLKVDIEGAEYELIPTLRSVFAERDVDLLLSLHPLQLAASFRRSPARGLLSTLIASARTWLRHLRLVYSLPFDYFYTTKGRRISRAALALHLLRPDFVATNRRWE